MFDFASVGGEYEAIAAELLCCRLGARSQCCCSEMNGWETKQAHQQASNLQTVTPNTGTPHAISLNGVTYVACLGRPAQEYQINRILMYIYI